MGVPLQFIRLSEYLEGLGHGDKPGEARVHTDVPEGPTEEVAERRWSEVLDVLWIVSPMPGVFSPAEVAESKERLPRDRHDTLSTADAGQFFHGAFRSSQVLQNLEARDDVRTPISERQHSRIRPDSSGVGKPLERCRELVTSIFDPDERAGSSLHRFKRKSFAYPNIDPGAFRRTCCRTKLP